MIVLNVTYRCKPGLRESFLERILAEGIDVQSRAEAGNLKYDYYLPFDDDGTLLLVEHWRDSDALRSHAEQPHYEKLKELKPEYVTETVVERFEKTESAQAGTEEQTVTITVKSKGDPCDLTDDEIRAWYEKRIASLFDSQWGTPEISVSLNRKK